MISDTSESGWSPDVGEFGVSSALALGWQSLKIGYRPLLMASFIALLIEAPLIILAFTDAAILGDVLGWFKQIFFDPPFMAGVAYMGVRLARGQSVDTGAMFAGFGRYWACVGIGVLIMIIVWVLTVVGMIAVGLPVMLLTLDSALGWGVLIVGLAIFVGLIVLIMARLWFAQVICIDDWAGRPPVLQCMSACWRITARGRWVRLVGLFLILLAIALASAVALVLPLLLFAMPFGIALWGAAYAQLSQGTLVPSSLSGACWNCGYSISGLPGERCPECGSQVVCGRCGAGLSGAMGGLCASCGAPFDAPTGGFTA